MRKHAKLSARAIALASKPGLYGDGGGLYLQCADIAGRGAVTKSWIFRFQLDGRARKMGLGSVNDFSLAEARDRARLARQQIADGIDPIEARIAERDARRKDEADRITFRDAAERFLKVHEPGWRNDKHRAQWRATLEKYAYPAFGARPIKAIDAPIVNHMLTPIWRETPETASRTKQRVERIIQWVNAGMPLPTPGKAKRVQHHAALPWQDIPAFMAELRARDSLSARALEFLILTAARTSEVISARWPELDMKAKVWTVPADRMKGNREHRVPLSKRAVEILAALPRMRGEAHVFPGTKKGAGLSNMAMLELLRGMRPGLTVHGFRSAFKDWASESTNHPNIVSEAALAHVVSDKVEAAYRRGELFEKRARLMRDWGAFCARPPAERGGNVFEIGRAS